MADSEQKYLLEWDQLPPEVLAEMRDLGNFGPTVRPLNREVKGYMRYDDGDDGRVYWDSSDLRRTAAACIRVADWLDARADAALSESANVPPR